MDSSTNRTVATYPGGRTFSSVASRSAGDWRAVTGRLKTVVPITPSITNHKLDFTYDFMNRRIEKKVYNWTGSSWSGQPSTHLKFVYDGWNLIEELDGLNGDTAIHQYTWGLDLSGQNGSPNLQYRSFAKVGGAQQGGQSPTGGIGGLLAMYIPDSQASYWYFYDANGNVGQVVNGDDGSFLAQYEYYPYGGELSAKGDNPTLNPFRFSTKYWNWYS